MHPQTQTVLRDNLSERFSVSCSAYFIKVLSLVVLSSLLSQIYWGVSEERLGCRRFVCGEHPSSNPGLRSVGDPGLRDRSGCSAGPNDSLSWQPIESSRVQISRQNHSKWDTIEKMKFWGFYARLSVNMSCARKVILSKASLGIGGNLCGPNEVYQLQIW